MNSRTLLGAVLLLSLLAGCHTTTSYTISVGEPTNGTVIESASAEFIDDWSGVQYEINYNTSYRDNSSYSFKVYEHVNGSLEFVDQSEFTSIEPSTPPTYRNDVAPPWDAGEKRVYEIRVVDDTTGAIVDSDTITIENKAS